MKKLENGTIKKIVSMFTEKRTTLFFSTFMMVLFAAITTPALAGIVAEEVIYSDVTCYRNYNDTDTVLGEIRRDTGGNYVVTPWNSPWTPTEIMIISSGTLTVRLSDSIFVTDDSMELGIYTAQMYALTSGSLMNGNMHAKIFVSENNTDWVALNNGESISLNTPSLGYQFPNNEWPNLSQWSGSLSDLEETDLYKPFDPSGMPSRTNTDAVLEYYGDSAGGNWFDLSETGLDSILYVKLEDIGGGSRGLRLDGFVGVSAVPVPGTIWLLGIGIFAVMGIRRKIEY